MKVTYVFTAVAGLGLQLVGVYAIAATFGAWTAVELERPLLEEPN